MKKKIIIISILATAFIVIGIFIYNQRKSEPKLTASNTTKKNVALSSSNSSSKIQGNLPKELTKSEMNVLLSKLNGNWFNLSDEEKIKEDGPRLSIYFEKKDDYYNLIHSYYDTAISRKVQAIKQLDNKGNYSITIYDDEAANQREEYTINLSNDYNTMYVTSQNDKNAKYLKANKKNTQYVQTLYLSGEYVDYDNKDYVFNADGTAKWPNSTLKFSVDYEEESVTDTRKIVTDYMIVKDNNGIEINRYIYERLGNMLCMYKVAADSQKKYKKGDLFIVLTKGNGLDLTQKAINIVGKKYNAVPEFRREDGTILYRSDLGNIYFECDGSYEKNMYKVKVYKEDSESIIKVFNVNVITKSVEECK